MAFEALCSFLRVLSSWIEQERGIIYFYISNQGASLDFGERLCRSLELLDRLVVALFGLLVNAQFVSSRFFLVGRALYYIFPQDLGHSLCVFDGLFCFNAASLDPTVLVE